MKRPTRRLVRRVAPWLALGGLALILSPAACGPPSWQVKRDWDVFVANRDECLETVQLTGISVGDRRVHDDWAEVHIHVGGQWIAGARDPGWFMNTPCAGFHARSEWLQGVERRLVYRRHNLVGWRIDHQGSFALDPRQTWFWDRKKKPREHVEESPENLAR